MAELTGIPGRAPEVDPPPPLKAGMLVAYLGEDGHLCGGSDDRAHGEVLRCEWTSNQQEFRVHLTDGTVLYPGQIRSVARINARGEIVAAWLTASHGLDGEKRPWT